MLTTKPLAFFKTDPKQPRKQYTESDLRSLGASMKTLGQLQPVGARPDGTLLWGERRYRAAQMVGLPELSVIMTDRKLSDSEIRLIQLTENMHRADLTGYEKWLACSELMSMNPTWQMKDLAQHLSIDPSMATRILSPSRCSPAWQQALKGREGRDQRLLCREQTPRSGTSRISSSPYDLSDGGKESPVVRGERQVGTGGV